MVVVPQISHVNSCIDVISFLILTPQAGTRELDAVLLQPLCFAFDIVHLKGSRRNSLFEHRFVG